MTKLYHYTSGTALHGIVENEELWATDLRFLNDYKELDHGLKLFEDYSLSIMEQAIKKLGSENNTEGFSYTTTQIIKNIRFHADLLPIHVVSFSKKEDNLRQWMAYCTSEVGYCIEFESHEILNNDLKVCNNIQIKNVDYQKDYSINSSPEVAINFQDELMNLLGKLRHSDNFKKPEVLRKVGHEIHIFLLKSMFSASAIKPIEFNDENEVRIIHIGKQAEINSNPVLEHLSNVYEYPDLPSPKHRLMSDIMIPYQIIPFNIGSIKSITIGPTHNQSLAEFGLKTFRDINSLSFEIKHSKCTLRRI